MGLTDLIDKGLGQMSLAPGESTTGKLSSYLQLIERWNQVTNLTAVSEPEAMVSAHLLDSLSINSWISGARIIDVGSGAGLPGIPLALLNPGKDFILLDSNGKKTRFMTQVKIELDLTNVEVVHSRVESYQGQFDHVVSRAYSHLDEFVSGCAHLLNNKGTLLAMKGPAESEPSAIEGFNQQVHKLIVPGLSSERYLVELSR